MTIVQLEKGAKFEVVYLETGRSDFSQDKRWRDHKKLVRFSKDSIDTIRKISKLKRVFNISSKRQILSIFAINIAGNALYFYFTSIYYPLLYYKLIVNNHITFIIGDVMELYAMCKESGIYKYCLIEEALIPLYITSPSVIYPLIHALMTLRMAVACTIYKILHNPNSEDNEYSSSEIAVMVSTPKNS